MRLRATYVGPQPPQFMETYPLDVYLNPLGGLCWVPLLHNQKSVLVRVAGLGTVYEYQTISEWRRDWRVAKPSHVQSYHIRLPLLRHRIGAGTAFECFAERLPLWVKSRFAGCKDRKAVWDLWLQFVPLRQ